MLDALSRHLAAATPRQLSHWEQYVATLRIRKDDINRKYQNATGYESRAIQLLRHILSLVDLDYLHRQFDDYRRYLYYLRFIRKDLANLFDPVATGRAYRKVFIEKKIFAPNEYLVPVDDVDHLAILPMDQPWEAWKQVRPVRLWDHDSPEYSLDLFQDRLAFRWVQPNYAIVTIDVVALAFKYYKYKTYPGLLPEERTDRNFLHKYVLDGFMVDQMDIWLLKQLVDCCTVVETTDIAALHKNTLHYDNNYGFIGNRYQEAMQSMFTELSNVRNGTVSVNAILSSALLATGSIHDRLQLLHRELDVAHLRQYDYIRFLMQLPLVQFIVELHSWQPTTGKFKSLIRELAMRIRSLQRERFWNGVHDPVVKVNLENTVLQLSESLTRLQERE